SACSNSWRAASMCFIACTLWPPHSPPACSSSPFAARNACSARSTSAGATSGRTSRENWTSRLRQRVKPAKWEGKRPNRSRRCMSPKAQPVTNRLMEEICERENLKQALQQVKANKGSAGVDGMTVGGITDYLKQHWPAIREQLLSGTYEPKPVRRVEIPKPDGGVRKLGIPTVLDRLIQQAVMQVSAA